MGLETELIKRQVEKFKADNSGEYSDYYIGITKHIEQRIVETNEEIQEHLQQGEYTKGTPIYSAKCMNRDEAVEIERYFQKLGMLKYNRRSFGDKDSKYIYCYRMTEENKRVLLSENSTNGKKMAKMIKKFKDFINGN